MWASSGRRIAPYRLSGTRATVLSASTTSTVRSFGVVSGGVGFLRAATAGAGFFAAGLAPRFVLSALVVSRAAARGDGVSLVGASESDSDASRSRCQLEARVSGSVIVYVA